MKKQPKAVEDTSAPITGEMEMLWEEVEAIIKMCSEPKEGLGKYHSISAYSQLKFLIKLKESFGNWQKIAMETSTYQKTGTCAAKRTAR